MENLASIAWDGDIAHVAGEIDISNVDALRAAIVEGNAIFVDLSDVTFMDSFGARLLVELHGRHACWFVRPSKNVARVMQILGVDFVLLAGVD
jgi:anti-anti-sigma factor